jgi:L-alanine-DL-glutamate epimerase-like enolase superfamily enzyme
MSDITRSAAFCAAVRETVLDRADILFGTHGQFSVGGAIRVAQAIEKYQPLWFEEPVPPDNVGAMAKVARATRIPIAAGERLTTKTEFATVLREGAAAILQPATGRCGGLWEAKKIAAMAEVYNAEVAPHLYAGPVEWAANVHLATTLPNLSMVETIGTGGGFHGDLISGAIRWQDGFIMPPEGPGLGIEVNEALLLTHAYDGDRLHLEMQESPCDWRHGNAFRGGAAD